MNDFINWLKQPWPWYVAGPLIGLIVPALLLSGNKSFGISANLRHICAACFPGQISFFNYNWKAEKWNLVFALGILLGGFIATYLLSFPEQHVALSPEAVFTLKKLGIHNFRGLLPQEIFSVEHIVSLRGFVFLVFGGFLIGFGTRYGGGCTSGHAIMGISTLQWPSLVATCCFMIGGILTSWFILPFLLSL